MGESLDSSFALSGGWAGLKVVASGNSMKQLRSYDLRTSEQSPSSPLCSRECTTTHIWAGRGKERQGEGGGRDEQVRTRHMNTRACVRACVSVP